MEAAVAVARLDQAAFRLPNPGLPARPAMRREAVSTSALEGTYAALDDVLEADFPNRDQLSASVAAVHNYVEAAELAFDRVKDKPITVSLLEHPLITVKIAAERFQVSNTAVKRLTQLGILEERTGRRYGRVFAARRVLNIINQ